MRIIPLVNFFFALHCFAICAMNSELSLQKSVNDEAANGSTKSKTLANSASVRNFSENNHSHEVNKAAISFLLNQEIGLEDYNWGEIKLYLYEKLVKSNVQKDFIKNNCKGLKPFEKIPDAIESAIEWVKQNKQKIQERPYKEQINELLSEKTGKIVRNDFRISNQSEIIARGYILKRFFGQKENITISDETLNQVISEKSKKKLNMIFDPEFAVNIKLSYSQWYNIKINCPAVYSSLSVYSNIFSYTRFYYQNESSEETIFEQNSDVTRKRVKMETPVCIADGFCVTYKTLCQFALEILFTKHKKQELSLPLSDKNYFELEEKILIFLKCIKKLPKNHPSDKIKALAFILDLTESGNKIIQVVKETGERNEKIEKILKRISENPQYLASSRKSVKKQRKK